MSRRWLYFAIPFLYIAVTYLIMFGLDRDTVDFVTAEDHYFEYAGALGLLLAAVTLGAAFHFSRGRPDHTRLRRLGYLALALLFFFGAGEEISWGQRILGIETPEVLGEVNAKDEINIHNLAVFHSGDKNTLPFKVFQAFAFLFTFAIPVLAILYKPARSWLEKAIPVLPWTFGLLVILNFGLSKVASSLTYLGQPGEIQESNYEVTFMILGLYVLFEIVRKRSASQSSPAGMPLKQASGESIIG